jgi:HTH-type transcriptional regulator/antitoxin HipB
MNFPVTTTPQLRAVLRGLRKSRALSQVQVGQLLGVNQKRVARIEGAPGVTSFDQIARVVAALGGRLVIEMPDPPRSAAAARAKGNPKHKAAPLAAKVDQSSW